MPTKQNISAFSQIYRIFQNYPKLAEFRCHLYSNFIQNNTIISLQLLWTECFIFTLIIITNIFWWSIITRISFPFTMCPKICSKFFSKVFYVFGLELLHVLSNHQQLGKFDQECTTISPKRNVRYAVN